jgi:hypothetical protein
VVPATLLLGVVADRGSSRFAVAPWLLGVFVLTLLVGWWMAPNGVRGLLAVTASALAAAAIAAVLLVALDHWTTAPQDHESMSANSTTKGAEPASPPPRRANLDDLDLSRTTLNYTDLHDVSAVRANFTGSSLMWADLRGADLRQANFASACLRGADLRGAQLSDATFEGSDLRGATVDEEQTSALPTTQEQSLSSACHP